jgi:dTDP-4-amino-4,6-dideoxygalactose transaminase
MTVFSFHPVKHITTGEGGAVLTNDDNFANKLQMLRNHGIDKNAISRSGRHASWLYDMKFLGRNYRMTDIQAALGISQLAKLDAFIDRRTSIANQYNSVLGKIAGLQIPVSKSYISHAWHIYTILLNRIPRNDVFYALRDAGIGVNVHYIPTYHFTYYKKRFNFNPKQFPVTEEVYNSIITLPLYPKMSVKDIETVIATTKQIIDKKG